jgi:hypothetical protein
VTPKQLAAADLRALGAELDEARERLQKLTDELAEHDPGPGGDASRPTQGATTPE